MHVHCSMGLFLELLSSVKGWLLTSLRSAKAKSEHKVFTFIPTIQPQGLFYPEAAILPK